MAKVVCVEATTHMHFGIILLLILVMHCLSTCRPQCGSGLPKQPQGDGSFQTGGSMLGQRVKQVTCDSGTVPAAGGGEAGASDGGDATTAIEQVAAHAEMLIEFYLYCND